MTWLLREEKAPTWLPLQTTIIPPLWGFFPLYKLDELYELDELTVQPPPAPALSKAGKTAPALLFLTFFIQHSELAPPVSLRSAQHSEFSIQNWLRRSRFARLSIQKADFLSLQLHLLIFTCQDIEGFHQYHVLHIYNSIAGLPRFYRRLYRVVDKLLSFYIPYLHFRQ